MTANFIFWSTLAVSLVIGFFYFRDLGDVSQMVLKVKRDNMLRFIRNEYRLIMSGLGALAVAILVHVAFDAGSRTVLVTAILLCAFLYGFPYVWVHVGLRNQKDSARYYSIEEAREYVSPSNQVLVIENNGVARAHPQAQLMRPHLAGNAEGLDGENVVMTYCAMANLGTAYTPEVAGEKLDLEVLAQHANNLILRDNRSGEPIQQIYGFRESDAAAAAGTPEGSCPLNPSQAMKPWPTIRMTFRGFQKAYPDGTVFLNKPSSNPLLFLFDMVMEMVFASSIERHHRENKPVMDNMTHFDDRLPNKTYVWGVSFGEDAVCWTDDYVVEQGNLVNAQVDGRALVVAWDPLHESLGVFYNEGGEPVTEIDFFGNTPTGRLDRVETLRPGMFWHVWAEFFPHTDINRSGDVG